MITNDTLLTHFRVARRYSRSAWTQKGPKMAPESHRGPLEQCPECDAPMSRWDMTRTGICRACKADKERDAQDTIASVLRAERSA